MIREPARESALDQAAKRLERAVALLEQRIGERLSRAGAEAGGLFDQDRSKLAADLDAARARQKELEAAGAEASAALGRAIGEIRAALDEPAEEDEPADEAAFALTAEDESDDSDAAREH